MDREKLVQIDAERERERNRITPIGWDGREGGISQHRERPFALSESGSTVAAAAQTLTSVSKEGCSRFVFIFLRSAYMCGQDVSVRKTCPNDVRLFVCLYVSRGQRGQPRTKEKHNSLAATCCLQQSDLFVCVRNYVRWGSCRRKRPP